MNKFNLFFEPKAYQLSIDVSNLILCYSKPEVRAALVMLGSDIAPTNTPSLALLEQLVKFYGQDLFSDVLTLHGVSNWNNIDFNVEDKAV